MIRINLLPVKEAEIAAHRSREVRLAVLLLVLLLLGLVADRIRHGQTVAKLDQQTADLEAELVVLRERVAAASRYEQQKKDLDAKLRVIADLSQKRVGPAGVLRDLSRATPSRLWLTDLTEAGGGATISGKAVDNQTIADFLRALAESPYFKSVELGETTRDDQGSVNLRRFLLRSTIDYAAKPKVEPAAEAAPASPAGETASPGAAAEAPPAAEGASR
jgi:type IV pilus assembly protein PilN